MCLITNQKEPFVADRDIVCYKALSESAGSIYRDFVYILGDTYETEILPAGMGYSHYAFDEEDSKALKLYRYVNEDRLRKMSELGYVSFGQGFHSAKKKTRIKLDYDEFLYKCIIPKGSQYYVNPSGLMVSNKIIVKGRV